MISYEQTLRLFERWCLEEANITEPEQVLETTIRHYICSLQERGKYTFYAVENCAITYNPARRRDFSQTVSTTTINNYIRNLKAFFTWYADTTQTTNPTVKIKQLRNERKAQEYLEDHEIEKLLKIFDRSYFPEHRDFMVIMLILDTGMRLGECLQVTTDDLDMDDRTICLPVENTKGRRTRFVYFSVKTAKSLQRWLRYKDRYTNGKLLFPIFPDHTAPVSWPNKNRPRRISSSRSVSWLELYLVRSFPMTKYTAVQTLCIQYSTKAGKNQ